MQDIKIIKIALIGIAGTGKTSFIKKLQDNTFILNWKPTCGKQNTRITRGNVIYDITEFSGREFYVPEMRIPLEGFDRVICMVNETKISYVSTIKYHDHINTSSIPTIFVRTKSDISEGYEPRQSRVTHYISTKTGSGMEELLEELV